uniref:7TM_GPCR_Srx domain-containing protein n=1 Tax=Strongyloides stercoralis TaxID=6248 RepID=A0A0K0EMG3_STRER
MSVTQSYNENTDYKIPLTESEVTINVYISIFVFILNNISMLFQSIVLYIFLRKPTILENIAYKIQMNIGICILIQEIIYMISGISGILNKKLSYIPDLILGGFMQGCFLSMISFISLLTLNAFDVFYDRRLFPNINRENFFKYCLYGCYIWGVIVIIFYSIPNFSLTFSLTTLSYRYRADTEDFIIGFEIENKFVISFLTISFFIYICIIVKIFKNRRLNYGIASQKSFYWSDVKFVIQTISNFIFFVVIEFLWKYEEALLSDSRYSKIAINILLILNNSNNTILITIMISDIKKEIKNLFLCKKKHKITIVRNQGNFKMPVLYIEKKIKN